MQLTTLGIHKTAEKIKVDLFGNLATFRYLRLHIAPHPGGCALCEDIFYCQLARLLFIL